MKGQEGVLLLLLLLFFLIYLKTDNMMIKLKGNKACMHYAHLFVWDLV